MSPHLNSNDMSWYNKVDPGGGWEYQGMLLPSIKCACYDILVINIIPIQAS